MSTNRILMFQGSNAPVLGLALVVGAIGGRSALAQATCCNLDIDQSGSVGFPDVARIVDCWKGIGVTPACDVNCDGEINGRDIGDVVCGFKNGTNCCFAPHEACCGDAVVCIEIKVGMCSNNPLGEGTTCDLGPCDCNNNGVLDTCDVECGPPGHACNVTGCGLSADCNENKVPDECENPAPATRGACCFSNFGVPACSSNATLASCDSLSGTWYSCKKCAAQSPGVVTEPGGEIFVHFIGPPVDCTVLPGLMQLRAAAACAPGSRKDPWVSPAHGQMCHAFGVGGSPPIPADFFGSGSDPFSGSVCLKGESLNDPEFPLADTLISRSSDPFDPCDAPSATLNTVDIEVVALNLVSVSPITVTFNGGQNPQQWDTVVDLSSVPAPLGSLTATKSYCNGGTYTSVLPVQPRFTFSRVGGTEIAVLDTGIAGRDPVVLTQTDPLPWVSDVDPMLPVVSDPCTNFHPGITDVIQDPTCDCNTNTFRDSCDLESRTSADCNGNAMPDECDITSGFSLDADQDGIPDECPAIATPLADLVGFDKCRFVSFSIAAPGGVSALRVKLTSLHHVDPPYTGGSSLPFTAFEGLTLWVGPPVQYVESGSDATPIIASVLQCTPHYQDWSTISLLHVTGEAVVPSSSLDVEVVSASCAGMEATCTAVSEALTINTRRSGDVAEAFQDPSQAASQPDFDDIGALVNKFKSLLGAPNKAQAKLGAIDARGLIDVTPDVGFDDISQDVDAFKGVPYPYKPGKCSGAPATACATNSDCGANGPCILCP